MADHLKKFDLNKYFSLVNNSTLIKPTGKVSKIVGLIAEGDNLRLSIGSLCNIINDHGDLIKAEVVGFRDEKALFMTYEDIRGISPGAIIEPLDSSVMVDVSDKLLGRIIDGMGMPIDKKGRIESSDKYNLYAKPVGPMEREPIKEALDVGVASINSMITLGKGQRIAIMAGSGVGKSVLMGMMTKHTAADVVVIGLIGERGREVKDFINDILGKQGLKRSVVVAATSDSAPLLRMRGAYLATTIAEYFKDQGKNVLLIIDSITRFAMSSRDVGLAAGEPPTSRGYTPSFFSQIPILLERAGNFENKGSITGIYTVLVEGDDLNDPVGDTVRSIVDGHIVLSRELANKGHYPAVDILSSISRVMRDVNTTDHMNDKNKLLNILSSYERAEDMITIGAYVDGSDPDVDHAKALMPSVNDFFKQDVTQKINMQSSIKGLKKLFEGQKNRK